MVTYCDLVYSNIQYTYICTALVLLCVVLVYRVVK
ncbi:hypothetical protein [Staphylococcus phage vB_SauM-V1SA19]|nr:hypothetical protein [Staphylococcus phage vB_SauM-V1SA19]